MVKNVAQVSNSLDLGEVSSRSKLFAYGTVIVLGGLRVNANMVNFSIFHIILKNFTFQRHLEELMQRKG